MSSRNLWKLNLPVFYGSTLWLHSRIYEFDGVWYNDLTKSESSFFNKFNTDVSTLPSQSLSQSLNASSN